MLHIGSLLHHNTPYILLSLVFIQGTFLQHILLAHTITYLTPTPPHTSPVFLFTTHFNPEDGGITVLQNVGIQQSHNTVQQPRKPKTLSSPPLNLQILHQHSLYITEHAQGYGITFVLHERIQHIPIIPRMLCRCITTWLAISPC